jgi:hypothetical protein
MDSIAVLLPRYVPLFEGTRRDALLSAHARGLAAACGRRTRARIEAIADVDPDELLARLGAFRPTHIVIEHSPLAYDRHARTALAAASWGRAHSIAVSLVSHPEFGRAFDPPEAAVANALLSAGPLVAQASKVFCHETAWARVIAGRVPTCLDRLDVLDAWPILEPANVTPVDAAAAALVLLDDPLPGELNALIERLQREGAACTYATVFAPQAGDGRLPQPAPIATEAELGAAIARASMLILACSRDATAPQRWKATAAAFARRIALVKRDGEVEQIERPVQSSWAAIVHAMISDEDRALAASFEEDVEEPSVGI